MQQDGQDRIKEEDKKVFGKFILYIVFMFLAGCIAGAIIGVCHKKGISIQPVGDEFYNMLAYVVPAAALLFNVIVFCVLHRMYAGAKRLYRDCGCEDEEQTEKIEQVECRINRCQFITEISLILNLFLLAAEEHVILTKRELLTIPANHWRWLTCIIIAGFVLGMTVGMVYKKNVVNLYKQMNPEKQGSIYDRHFAAKWEDSCDEREKFLLYKAGYKAFYFS